MTESTSFAADKSMSNQRLDEHNMTNPLTIVKSTMKDPEKSSRREPTSRFPPICEKSDSGRIRDRLLNRLGIEKEHHILETPDRSNVSALRHSEDVAFDELLKAD
jgi:hypothetical protein